MQNTLSIASQQTSIPFDCSLEGLTTTVNEIHQALNPVLHFHEAANQVEKLYSAGEKHVCAEVSCQPLLSSEEEGTLFPVVVGLNSIFDLNTIQGNISFLRPLIAAYRLFIELSWYQTWRSNQTEDAWSLHEQQLAQVRKSARHVQKLIKSLPRIKAADIRFELRCAEQGLKILVSGSGILWQSYMAHLSRLIPAAVELNVPTTILALADIAKEMQEQTMQTWYIDVHRSRWLSLRVRSEEDFEKLVAPDIVRYIEQQHKYATCCAAVFAAIIAHPETTSSLKRRALMGCEDEDSLVKRLVEHCHEPLLGEKDSIGLIHLAFGEDPKSIRRRFGLRDPFWNMRHVALHYLAEMRKGDSAEEVKKLILKVFEARRGVSLQHYTPSDQPLQDRQESQIESLKDAEVHIVATQSRIEENKERQIELQQSLDRAYRDHRSQDASELADTLEKAKAAEREQLARLTREQERFAQGQEQLVAMDWEEEEELLKAYIEELNPLLES